MLLGGPADKGGNTYENYVAINEICHLLSCNDDNSYIYFEKPDEIKEGAEFEVFINGKKMFFQVKRHQKNWTINKLYSEKILQNFYLKFLKENNASWVFYTSSNSDLEELIDRAKRSNNLQEFLNFINQTNSVKENLNELCKALFAIKEGIIDIKNVKLPIKENITDSEEEIERKNSLNIEIYNLVFNFLKNTQIKLNNENTLKENSYSLVSSIFKEPEKVFDGLFRFAQEEYCKKYTKSQLIEYCIKQKKYQFLNLYLDNSLICKINENNDSFIEDVDFFYENYKIVRKEPLEVFNILNNPKNEAKYIFISGEAGSGKSIVLKETLKTFKENNWQIISFSIDKLNLLNSPEELGKILYGKEISPSKMLNNIAVGKNCLLVIDQLDALSTVSGRNIENWNIINKILKESGSYENLKVIIACREFDLEKDYNLKEFLKNKNQNIHKLKIDKLDSDDVKNCLVKMGIDESNIKNEKISFFSLPLHLKVLAEIYDSSKDNSLNYLTRVDLYNEFWERKRQKLNNSNWINIVNLMVEYLNKNKKLIAPESIFEKYSGLLNSMISENVFNKKDNYISFFHETFFDYCFARLLASEADKTLLNFIEDSDQSLFIRSQVRQTLEYLRSKYEKRYLSELLNILNSKNVRFHIKLLIIDLLNSFDDISSEELTIINGLDKEFLDILFNKKEYMSLFFKMWSQNNFLKNDLCSKEENLIKKALDVLYFNNELYLQEITDLWLSLPEENINFVIKANISKEQNNLYILKTLPFLTNDNLFQIVLSCFEEGLLNKNYLDNVIHDFKRYKLSLDKLFEIYKVCLNILKKEYLNDKNIFNTLIFYEFEKFIEKEPELFLSKLFDEFVDIISNSELKSKIGYEGLIFDELFYFRWYDSPRETILDYFEIAFQKFAETKPDKFWSFIEKYKKSDKESILFLVLRGFLNLPESFSDKIIEYLIQNPQVYNIGYSNYDNYPTMQLINKFSKTCSDEVLGKFIDVLLNHKDYWEFDYFKYNLKNKNRRMGNGIGYKQGKLLDSIEYNKLINYEFTYKKLEELKRKFKISSFAEKPDKTEAKFIGSPIPNNKTKKMNNEQWLKAIEEYNNGSKEFLKGGPIQLSRELEEVVKESPAHFIDLAYKLNKEETNTYFYSAIMDGIACAANKFSDEEKIKLLEYYHSFDKKPFGSSIIRLLATFISKDKEVEFPTQGLEILKWYAENGISPEKEEILNDIDTDAINCVRGKASELISDILWSNIKYKDYFMPTIKKLINDFLPVRAISAEILKPIFNQDENLALSLFEELVDSNELVFTSKFHVQRFIHQTRNAKNYDFYNNLFSKINPQNEKVKEFIAYIYCVFSLWHEPAKIKAKEMIESLDSSYRAGAAKLFSNAIENKDYFDNDYVLFSLEKLANDEDERVKDKSVSFVNRVDIKIFLDNKKLMKIYILSKAFCNSVDTFLYNLEKINLSSANLEEIILIINRYIEIFEVLKEKSYGLSGDHIFDLILKIYKLEENNQVLDFMDEFLKLPQRGYKNKINEFERLL